MPRASACGLVITADDFGLHDSVNRAVERAHACGVLTAASLMVGARAAVDAVARARAMPGLRVGLHLVLVDGQSVLPPRAIPDLVDGDGRFGIHMMRMGWRYACFPRVRRQLAREIRAQYEAFTATGLALDHVNAHKHFHLHPTILSLAIAIGREFGVRAMRLPREAKPTPGLWPCLRWMRSRLDEAGIAHNDTLVGLRMSGRFDEAAMLHALATLPAGVTELMLHPALVSGAAVGASMPRYRHADEFAALVSPRVQNACARLRACGVRSGGFGDMAWSG